LRTAAQVRQFVQATPAAVGYVDVGFTDGLHVLRYEGVACERSTIRSGAYPARRPLGIVTRGRPRGPLARFLQWIGTSRKARQVVATRYLTVSR
jgi:phosphate transport system substrate-binding protein